MDSYQNSFMNFPGITPEEMGFLQQGTAELTEDQKKYFYLLYSSKRKTTQEILIFTIIGFFGIAGIQRFVVGQIGMGLLYLFTGGLCAIGTIVDLINNRSITDDYNRRMAYESYHIAKVSAQ